MSRAQMEQFLRGQWRTHRWCEDGRDGYEAVETTPTGLRWFRWSHAMVGGGERDVLLQSWGQFRESGPPRDLPEGVRAELERAAALAEGAMDEGAQG